MLGTVSALSRLPQHRRFNESRNRMVCESVSDHGRESVSQTMPERVVRRKGRSKTTRAAGEDYESVAEQPSAGVDESSPTVIGRSSSRKLEGDRIVRISPRDNGPVTRPEDEKS